MEQLLKHFENILTAALHNLSPVFHALTMEREKIEEEENRIRSIRFNFAIR